MDILILAHSRWEGKYSSTILSLAKVFSRDHRVFYVGKPYTIKDLVFGLGNKEIRKRLPALLLGIDYSYYPIKGNQNFVVIIPPVAISINWLPKGKLFSQLMKFNDQLLFNRLQKAIQKFKIKNYTFINSFQPLYSNYFPEDFKPRKFVYHCVDEINNSPYVSKHGKRLEKVISKRADEVITTSKELYRHKLSENNEVSIVPNGADVQLFQRATNEVLIPPLELRGIRDNTKVIIYIGNICHRIDYPLLNKIATNLPNHLLMMIGPLSHPGYKEYNLTKHKNIIFTGPKKLEELPAYLRYSHCGIIPFLCNQVTKCIYPLKVNEYLSAGLPVVSTRFSEDIHDFSNIISIADSADEFIKSIQSESTSNSIQNKQRRIEFASANSWEDRAEKFLEILRRDNQWNTKTPLRREKRELIQALPK